MVPHLLPISREKATVEAHEVSICSKLLTIHSLIIEALIWAGLHVHISIVCFKQCISRSMKQTTRKHVRQRLDVHVDASDSY
jgi:hypothetical protein